MPSKILIIEDDTDMRNMIMDKLMPRYEVVQAEDGEQGMLKFFSQHPDLVILDLMLPKMNGFEVLQAIQEKNDLSKTPVVIYSNLNKPEAVQQARHDYNIQEYYTKAQTQVDDLCARVEQLISNR
jgi:DNA-binding response OmpR family regulator